jgi:hypothetical protein
MKNLWLDDINPVNNDEQKNFVATVKNSSTKEIFGYVQVKRTLANDVCLIPCISKFCSSLEESAIKDLGSLDLVMPQW